MCSTISEAAGPPADGLPVARASRVEARLGVTFRERSLLALALVHQSYLHENPESAAESNERLEFLGDALIGLVVAQELYGRLPDVSEGVLTARRSLAVRGEALARVASHLELGEELLMGQGERTSGGAERVSNLAGVFEAVVGALLLDRGYRAARKFVLRALAGEIAAAIESESPKDPKSVLQELAQSRGGEPPRYDVTGFEGPEHARTWRVDAVLNGRVVGRGEGRRKLDAERNAAREALQRITAELDGAPAPGTAPAGETGSQ